MVNLITIEISVRILQYLSALVCLTAVVLVSVDMITIILSRHLSHMFSSGLIRMCAVLVT